MPRKVSLIILLSLVIVLVLGFGMSAVADTGGSTSNVPSGGTNTVPTGDAGTATTGGGSGDATVAAARAQLGKPHVEGKDGPDAFSCTGLARYALRASGKDPEAPWDPSGYPGRYPPATGGDLPGDIWDYGGSVAIYAGNGKLVMSNLVDGMVEELPADVMGTPVAKVRP